MEAEEEDTKEEYTQAEANRSSSKEDEVEEKGDEDGELVPHSRQGVHGVDLGRPADTGSSNYTQYVTIEATQLVKAEYTIENIKHPATPIISNDGKPNEIIDLERELIISKDRAKYNKNIQINPKVAKPNKILDSKGEILINELNSLIFQDDIAKMSYSMEDARKGATDC